MKLPDLRKRLSRWMQALELVGFATVCAGIALVNLPAGIIATGLVLVLVANARS